MESSITHWNVLSPYGMLLSMYKCLYRVNPTRMFSWRTLSYKDNNNNNIYIYNKSNNDINNKNKLANVHVALFNGKR